METGNSAGKYIVSIAGSRCNGTAWMVYMATSASSSPSPSVALLVSQRKPDRVLAMQQLIDDIRKALPFDEPYAMLCQKQCVGCPKKLMEFLESELEGWEGTLAGGDEPSLGDINRLAKTSRKIHRVLEKNGLTKAG